MPDLIVKVGGGLLSTDGDLDRVLAAVRGLARSRRVLVVPGGGPFADAVRAVDRQLGLPDDAAHWMAVLAMDQYAHLLAARLVDATIVTGLAEARAALATGRVPVLAPASWLRQADPLPHSWDVTSDSIAAWVAGIAGARGIVLVKPRRAAGDLVDRGFAAVIPRQVATRIVTADQVDVTFSELGGRREWDAEIT